MTDSDEQDRSAILKRRAAFIAAAAGSLGVAVACSSAEPQPCLKLSAPSSDAATDASQASAMDATPRPCLDIGVPQDASIEAGVPFDFDAGPQPCLKVKAIEPSKPKPK
jgi:hypothetical protein